MVCRSIAIVPRERSVEDITRRYSLWFESDKAMPVALDGYQFESRTLPPPSVNCPLLKDQFFPDTTAPDSIDIYFTHI